MYVFSATRGRPTTAKVVFGLITAVLVWLVFSTGFFTVLTVSLVLGTRMSLLRGKSSEKRDGGAMSGRGKDEMMDNESTRGSRKPG